jgi:hypothetical protein
MSKVLRVTMDAVMICRPCFKLGLLGRISLVHTFSLAFGEISEAVGFKLNARLRF